MAETSAGSHPVMRSAGVLWWSLGAVAAVVLVAAVSVGIADTPYAFAGNDDPGRLAAAAYALLRLIAAISGGMTLGSLTYTLFCTAPTVSWRIDTDGYAGVLVAQRFSVVWLAAAVALIPVSAADSAGVTVAAVVRHQALWSLVSATEKPKAWIVVTVLVTVIAVGTRLAFSWITLLGLAALGAVAVLPPAVTGNAGEGPNHDLATGAVILFAVAASIMPGLAWCVAAHIRRGGQHGAVAVKRFWTAMTLCLLVAGLAAVVLTAILVPPSAVLNSTYGRVGLGAAALFTAIIAVITRVRSHARAGSPNPGRVALLVTITGALTLVWSGALVALAVQPAPAFDGQRFTAQDVLLGFDLPDPPSVLGFATLWRFDFVLGTAALLGIGLYWVGALRLRRRGDFWSGWRALSWTAGCVVLLIMTSSGVAAYGYGMFSVHMATHMALNMFIPVLLVLGAPVTLILRAVRPVGKGAVPGPREWILALMHSRVTRVLANPGVAIAVFVISLYGLYFTSLFSQLIRFHWGHELMNIHFLVTGYVFYWAIIGIDPGPRRLPFLARLGMLFALMPFHTFFGIAVMSMDSLIGGRFYRELQLPWLGDLAADQHLGGAIAWVSGEIPVLLVVGALLSQWARQDRRDGVRSDRRDDDYEDSDLDAYNAMLAQLATSRRAPAPEVAPVDPA
jgi:cytochrome c oxidase assembly factor CtaG